MRDSIWTRLLLRGIHYRDRYQRLDAIYLVRDPWGMEADREQFRFRETNRLIEEHIGQVSSILEIGCGEGHQSSHLVTMCDRLYGIDVSARAVGRATERCPRASFVVGDIFDSKVVSETGRFDLVVACEVLYYVKDVPATLDRMSAIGRWCLATYYDARSDRLEPHLVSLPGQQSMTIRYEATSWKAHWWKGNSVRS